MTSKPIDGVSRELLDFTAECLERCQDQAFQTCECESCPQCGKMPDECTGTDCAKTCQCSTCEHCVNEEAIKAIRALLAAPEAPRQEPVAPNVVGYMPDSPDGDPLITLESHQTYVGGLCAKIKALCNHPSMSFHQIALLEGVLPLDDDACKTDTTPLSPDLVHDRAYRNGLMAGFQFGISGNEKGYATAINKFNTEIHAAKADPLSPDHSGGGAGMVIEYAAKSLATITSSDGSGHADIALSVMRQAGYASSHAKKLVDEWKSQRSWANPECKARGAGEVILPDRMQIPDQETFVGGNAYYAKSFDEARIWNACLDKVKELNQ